jgi:hypothetical protein
MKPRAHELEILLTGDDKTTWSCTLYFDQTPTAHTRFVLCELESMVVQPVARIRKAGDYKSVLKLNLSGGAAKTKLLDISHVPVEKWKYLLADAVSRCPAIVGIMLRNGRITVGVHSTPAMEPQLWVLEPNDKQASCRLEYRFVDQDGNLMKLKAWDIHRAPDDPPKALLLQLDGCLATGKPKLEHVLPHMWVITTVVTRLDGEISTATYSGRIQDDGFRQLISRHALTLVTSLDEAGVYLSLFTANKPSP